MEDHRWWWRSFLCGGSTALFVLGYCFFYYHFRWARGARARFDLCGSLTWRRTAATLLESLDAPAQPTPPPRSDMSGFMQSAFFFGYNAVACYAFFLMLGAVGWWSSHLFVMRIFQAVKVE